MGRKPYSDRPLVEECSSISISKLKKEDFFQAANVSAFLRSPYDERNISDIKIQVDYFNSKLSLSYTFFDIFKGERDEINYQIPILTTPCNYGGLRYWFQCPITINRKPCNKRVGVLYRPHGAKYFGCRHCFDLAYKKQREHRKFSSKKSGRELTYL